MPKTLTSSSNTLGLVEQSTFESVEDLYAVLGPVMRATATAAGSHTEVVLHDLSARDMQHTIYAIENGHVSGRAVGGPSTNLGLEVLQNEDADHNSFGYMGHTPDGRELHCSSIYYRNSAGKIIAAFCINVDLTPLQSAQNAIASLLPPAKDREVYREHVAPDIATLLDNMVDEAVASVGKPPSLMDKSERTQVLRYLEQRGAFHVKRAVEQVAKRLGVSKVTAYSYLDEVRNP